MRSSRLLRVAGTAVAGLLTALVIAAPASAASCSGRLSQPFAPWGDLHAYDLAPNGALESTNGWTLTGGAALVMGSEPFAVTGRLGQYSLSIPDGATATSPEICLDATRPTFRFFGRAAQGASATLRADAVAARPSQFVSLGSVAGTTAWAPVPAMATGTTGLVLGSKGTVAVRMRFTATGDWQIDDLYVDPRKMG